MGAATPAIVEQPPAPVAETDRQTDRKGNGQTDKTIRLKKSYGSLLLTVAA